MGKGKKEKKKKIRKKIRKKIQKIIRENKEYYTEEFEKLPKDKMEPLKY